MRKYLLFLLILISKGSFAQAPQSFKYQAVVRDAAGLLAVNKIISIRTSILSGSATGSSVYTEKQTLSTNDYGVVSLNIGAGTLVSGNFSTINWGASTYFVKTELDINGASTYVFMGASQILSVPYALYAEKTGSSLSDHDTSATNEIQNLSVVGSNLSISGGNTIALPPDADSNPLNELQNLSITGDSLHITSGNSIYLSGAVDLDASPLNEIQNLSLDGDSLKISLGNNVVFPHDNDRDSINEIQNLSISGNVISISKSNSITLSDNNPTNELQNLNINQGTISISNGNSIHIPDSSATNELQSINLNNDSLSISNAASILYLGYLALPVGSVIPFAGSGTPDGYLFCDGSVVSRTTFQKLFIAIGTNWGAGDGATTFNLPDLRGIFMRGYDSSAGNDPDKLSRTAKYSGGNSGNNVGSYQDDQLKSHTHATQISGSLGVGPGVIANSSVAGTSGATGGAETRGKNAYVKYIIKYK